MNIHPEPSPCPFCKSSKISVEGNGTRFYAVCQKCLARGPEVRANVLASEFRDIAINEWNTRNRGKFSKVKCPECGRLVCISSFGIWSHRVYDAGRFICCPGSNLPMSAISKLND